MDAEAWDERYAASELVWSAEPNRFVAEELADLPPGRAVDLAAGEGRNAIWLARRGWQVTAVDFSAVALEKGARLAGVSTGSTAVDVEWVVADATTWRADEPLDLAVIAYLQVPAAARRAANRNAVESLRAGRDVPARGPRLDQPGRGHRRTAGPDRADDRRGRPRRPRRDRRRRRQRRPRAREVVVGDDHRGEASATAWDCLVRLVRR